MDIWQIRLINFRRLRDREDVLTSAELARRIGMSPQLLQAYMGKSPTKRIGDETVKKAMDAFGLPAIWFDTLHDGDGQPVPANASQIVSWPFATERARFEALPLEEKERIGRFVRDTVEAWEAKQTRAGETP
ncbi:helix-turn-helix domain-containing protein [Paraburkholderia sp. GAS82]|uniref:helix-turn-helix domain-containing protein n=1 Tax=Paraburkholderia sp. GAS82 TaxID=3035137 RepID=UPI003D1EED0D